MCERVVADKCVAVTGGASGIGYAIAESFASKGSKQVFLLDINENVGAEAVKAINSKYGDDKAVFVQCDITNDQDTEAAFNILKDNNVTILVNNAGVLCEKNVKKCVDINLTALITWSVKMWDSLRKDKSGAGGTIVNVSSIYGYRIDQFIPVYQATKFGVYGFSKSLGHAYNYERTGVRVVAICPGFTKTALGESLNDELLDDYLKPGFDEKHKAAEWQSADAVGAAVVEVCEKSDSGKAWLIEGGKPIVEV